MIKTRAILPFGATALLVIMMACGDSEEEDAPLHAAPSPTPTALAVPRDRQVGPPTPTPVPIEDKRLALDFAVGHRGLTDDWDRFHGDFDSWRQDQMACDASAAEVSLREFAASFSTISSGAAGLPRGSIVRNLADAAVSAAGTEAAALRLLRDSWRPDDNTPFQHVDVEREKASTLRAQIEDAIDDLRTRTGTSSRNLVDTFVTALDRIQSDWDAFHRAYDALRTEERALSSTSTATRLSALVDEFSVIVIAIRELPVSDATRPVALVLSQAADEEDLTLRRMRGNLQNPDAGARRGQASQTDSEGGTSDGSASRSTDSELVPTDPALFEAFDIQLVRSNSLRSQAADALAVVVDGSSAENQTAVDAFAEAYDQLSQQWDRFHAGYSGWRATDGGCDRAAVVTVLGEFSIRLGSLADEIRGLPRATVLRPLGELMVTAVEREDDALRLLRNTWRPFDSTVFTTFDNERAAVNRLRRQVAAGVEDLLPQFNLSAADVESESSSSR